MNRYTANRYECSISKPRESRYACSTWRVHLRKKYGTCQIISRMCKNRPHLQNE